MLKFLKIIAKRNPALARALEVSIISSFISWVIALLSSIQSYFTTWSIIDYKLIIALFIASLITGITSWLTKWLRDKQREIDPSIDEDTIEITTPSI